MNRETLKIALFTFVMAVITFCLFVIIAIKGRNGHGNNNSIQHIIRDTTIVSINSPLTITDFKLVERKGRDTVYIESKDSILLPVPMYDYNFKEDGLYDIDVYGYNVKLNKVEVYPQTKIVTVTQTVEKIAQEGWDCYLRGGFGAFNGGIVPKVGFMLKAPNRVSFGGNIGYYNNNLAFDLEVGYKIF